jgi:hypothetical protein
MIMRLDAQLRTSRLHFDSPCCALIEQLNQQAHFLAAFIKSAKSLLQGVLMTPCLPSANDQSERRKMSDGPQHGRNMPSWRQLDSGMLR